MTTRNSTILLFFILSLGCQDIQTKDTKVIEGDLYFSYFRIINLYNLPDSIVKRIVVFADTVNRTLLDSADIAFLKIYDTLKSEKLLYNPYIELKLDTGSITTLILNQKDYRKIAPTNYQLLIDTKKKIRIKAEVRQIVNRLKYCSKLILVDTLNGETLTNSKKFKIADYR